MITKENWPGYLSQELYDRDVPAAGECVDGEQLIVMHGWDGVSRLADHLAELLGGTAVKKDEFHIFVHVEIPPASEGETDDDVLREYLSGLEDDSEGREGTKLLGPEMVDDLVEHVSWKDSKAVWRDDRVLEALFGASVGFSDEYDVCEDCQKIIHYGAESYGDIGRFFRHPEDGSLTCRDCIQKKPQEFLEYAAQAKEPLHCPVDPRDHGYVDVRAMYSVAENWNKNEPFSFEHGWYGGQIDNPTKQKAFLSKCFIRPVFFDIQPSQFQVSWNLLVHEMDQTLAEQALFGNPGYVRFWTYNQSVIILFLDDDANKATIHIRWEDVAEPDQQVEYTEDYRDELPDDPSKLLHRLTQNAYLECVRNNSLKADEQMWFKELMSGFDSGEWEKGRPVEFFRDVKEKKDPKEVLAAGFKAAAAIPRSPDPDKIRIVSIHDGTAEAKDVTREQFIEGVPNG